MTFNGITILGLGPGDPQLMTCQAWEILENSKEIYLKSHQHPVIDELPEGFLVHSLEDLFVDDAETENLSERLVSTILGLGKRKGGVVYAVPGNPVIDDVLTSEITQRAEQAGVPVRVISGLSFIDPVCTALNIDLLSHTVLWDASELARLHVPPFAPSVPAIITQIQSREIAAEIKLTLMSLYPDNHPVKLVHAGGTAQEVVEVLQLFEIDRGSHIGMQTYLYVPPLDYRMSFEAFLEVIAHLRAPDGCPWDRQQDYKSLRSDLLEETYEALNALDADDPENLREELGDLVLLILMLSQIASESGDFTISDVLLGIHEKIVRRHPHVFGDQDVSDEQEVLQIWEQLKAEERSENGKSENSLLEGVSSALPALTQAQAYQKRAAWVGFDWSDLKGVIDKLNEELAEMQSAENAEEYGKEIGDLLFSVVNLARWKGVDAESALRESNARFYRRFAYIEDKAKEKGRLIQEMTIEEMESLWQEAKKEAHFLK